MSQGSNRDNTRRLRRLLQSQKARERAAAALPTAPQPSHTKARKLLSGLFGAGATGVGIGLAIGSFTPSGLLNMATAYAMLAGGWVATSLAIVVSEWVWEYPAKHRVLVAMASCGILGAAFIWLGHYEFEQNYEATHLVADNLPSPPSGCPASEDYENKLLVFFGPTSVLIRPDVFPYTLIAMGRDRSGQPLPLLVIDRNGRGISIKTLRIYGSDGKLITKIDEDSPWTNSNFNSKKVSPHQLIVYDEQDQEVLNLNYINNHTVTVTGIFRHPRMAPIEVMNSKIMQDTNSVVIHCIRNSLVSAFRFDGPQL